MGRKMIAISEKTYHNLAELGNLEDSFDSVISRMIQKEKAVSGQQPLGGSGGQTTAAPQRPGGRDG